MLRLRCRKTIFFVVIYLCGCGCACFEMRNRIFPGDVFIKPSESAADRVRVIDVVVQIDTGDEPRIKLVCNTNGHGATHFQIKIQIPISFSLMNLIPLRIHMFVHRVAKACVVTLPCRNSLEIKLLALSFIVFPLHPKTLNSTRNLDTQQHQTHRMRCGRRWRSCAPRRTRLANEQKK